jgi:hypothetical protein
MVRAPDSWQLILEQVQKTDSEVHILPASSADKGSAASLGQALLTPDEAKWFDQARFRTHFVHESTDHSKALFDRLQALASASGGPNLDMTRTGTAIGSPHVLPQRPINVTMAGAGVGTRLGLSGFLAVEGLKNTASAVGNPAALLMAILMAMVLGGALLGSSVAAGALQGHRRYRWPYDWKGRLIASAADNGPQLEANWQRRGFNLVPETRYRLVQEEYRPRWGARSSKPLGGAKASPVGSTPASSAHPCFQGQSTSVNQSSKIY